MKKLAPILTLFLINSITIIGVCFLGWNIYQIILVFLMECFMVGFFNVLKMALAEKKSDSIGVPTSTTKTKIILFFCLHYFAFIFILSIVTLSFVIDIHKLDFWNFDFKLAFISLMIACLANFYSSYIMTGIYHTTKPDDFFFAPYGRIMILAALVFSTVCFKKKMMPVEDFYAFILVGAKFIVDLISYFLFNRTTLSKS